MIYLASFPRSGSTFLRLILLHKYGYNSNEYNVKNKHFKLIYSNCGFKNADYNVFTKTHSLHSNQSKAVIITRDPRSVAISWYYHKYSKKYSLHKWLKLKLKSFFNSWNEFHNSWLQCNNTLIIKYENLLNDENETEKIFDHFKLPYNCTGSTPTFLEMHQKFPKFFRKGKATWQDELPSGFADLIIEKCISF